jgi:hypothetical protein
MELPPYHVESSTWRPPLSARRTPHTTDGRWTPPPPAVRDVPARREPFNLPPGARAVNEWPGGAGVGRDVCPRRRRFARTACSFAIGVQSGNKVPARRHAISTAMTRHQRGPECGGRETEPRSPAKHKPESSRPRSCWGWPVALDRRASSQPARRRLRRHGGSGWPKSHIQAPVLWEHEIINATPLVKSLPATLPPHVSVVYIAPAAELYC